MIAPTIRAIAAAALGAPLAVALALVDPGLGVVGAAWPVAMIGLVALDSLLAPDRGGLAASVDAPAQVAARGEASARVRIALGGAERAPLEVAVETGPLLRAEPPRARVIAEGGAAELTVRLKPRRRGRDGVAALWVRWRGPLGFVAKSRRAALDPRAIAIIPDVEGVAREAERMFSRTALFGLKPQRDRGDGAEFDSLVEFRRGMDQRAIDWKQSARHVKLLAKERRAERNHHVALVFDAGRVMSEPLRGAPRIDRALDAALLLGFVSLRLGDRVAAFAFDDRPRLFTGLLAGMPGFRLLREATSELDYSATETNFTLGLATLGGELKRRAMVVVFTDFADSTSAELMIESLGRLMRRHLVVFVAFRDEELEALRDAAPQTPEDVSRAVIAASLLKERDAVIARLTRLGAQVVDAPLDGLGPALVAAYDRLRRREAR